MEEKSKVVELKGKKEEETKLSYEQLNDAAMQLSYQLENAKRQLASMNMSNLFKRLDYLFKVVEFSDKFDEEFVITCTDEIKTLIAVPEESENGEQA